MRRDVVLSNALGLCGAVIGGVVGHFAFGWLLGQGLYGLILPGGLLGLGCLLLSGHNSTGRGIACGVAAMVLALFSEWWYRPFAADESLGFFVQHLGDLKGSTWLMAGVGSFVAYWSGRDHAALVPSLAGRRGPSGAPGSDHPTQT